MLEAHRNDFRRMKSWPITGNFLLRSLIKISQCDEYFTVVIGECYPKLHHLVFCPQKWKWKSLSHIRLFVTSCTINPWNSPGQNTGVGSLSLLQGIFPTQRLNPGLLHCRPILYQLSHRESPRILEWIAYPFSRRSSRLRNWTRVSYTVGTFHWAIREAAQKWNLVKWIFLRRI